MWLSRKRGYPLAQDWTAWSFPARCPQIRSPGALRDRPRAHRTPWREYLMRTVVSAVVWGVEMMRQLLVEQGGTSETQSGWNEQSGWRRRQKRRRG